MDSCDVPNHASGLSLAGFPAPSFPPCTSLFGWDRGKIYAGQTFYYVLVRPLECSN